MKMFVVIVQPADDLRSAYIDSIYYTLKAALKHKDKAQAKNLNYRFWVDSARVMETLPHIEQGNLL